jgi:L-lysine exporter family protein LysE/ArgO
VILPDSQFPSKTGTGEMNVFIQGFALGFSLILAIGAQNAFVLQQGIRRQHVFAVALTCGVCDAVLIIAGVAGFAVAVEVVPAFVPVLRYGGAAFLVVYGAMAFRSAWRGNSGLQAEGENAPSLRSVLVTVLALTWLNPHVYLDTVVLVGSVAQTYDGAKTVFALGACTASFTFFFSLAYGARLLAPMFARPMAWRVLDVLVGIMMWTIAATLLLHPVG